jgi:DNA-binding CsgD family transcriptional regulator
MEIVSCGSWQGFLGNGLAERELACLLAVAAGHTDKEIAKRDGLSPRSIKGRIESVMFKLGVYKRPALIAEAMRRGLITPLVIALCAVLVGQTAMSENHFNRTRRNDGRRVEARVALRRIEVALTA